MQSLGLKILHVGLGFKGIGASNAQSRNDVSSS